MGFMSYCQYQNTLGEMEVCQERMQSNEQGHEDMSEEEKSAKLNLIALCKDIAEEFGHLL